MLRLLIRYKFNKIGRLFVDYPGGSNVITRILYKNEEAG